MLYITYFLNAVLMLAMPIGLAMFLARKMSSQWRFIWVGATTFILSQVVHLPLNAGLSAGLKAASLSGGAAALAVPIVFGLSAGVCEEGARYLVLRFWLKEARSWRSALLFGAGHGGIEAIIFGGLVLWAFFRLSALRGADLSAVVPADKLALVQQQVAAYWSAPWYASLLGAVERAFALAIHLSLAVMVMQVFSRGKAWWLFAAIGWHALVDGAAVFTIQRFGIYWTEAAAGVFALASLGFIFRLKRPEVVESPTAEALPENLPRKPFALEATAERIDETRYAG